MHISGLLAEVQKFCSEHQKMVAQDRKAINPEADVQFVVDWEAAKLVLSELEDHFELRRSRHTEVALFLGVEWLPVCPRDTKRLLLRTNVSDVSFIFSLPTLTRMIFFSWMKRERAEGKTLVCSRRTPVRMVL